VNPDTPEKTTQDPQDESGAPSPAAVEEQAEVEASAEPAAPPAEPDPIAELTAERDKLAAESIENRDNWLRTRAEFDNFRKRTERERSEFVQYAGMEVIRDILPIVDDFERAKKVACVDAEYLKGIELIYQRLDEALKKLGLEPIEAAGQPFDPNVHMAVQRVESADVEAETVLEEFQRGYNFKGKLLRPAMVKVAVKGA